MPDSSGARRKTRKTSGPVAQDEAGAAPDDDDVAAAGHLADDLLGELDDLLARVEERVRIGRRPAGAHAGLQRRERPDQALQQGPGPLVFGLDLARRDREPAGDFLDQLLVDDFGAELGGDDARHARATGAELAGDGDDGHLGLLRLLAPIAGYRSAVARSARITLGRHARAVPGPSGPAQPTVRESPRHP